MSIKNPHIKNIKHPHLIEYWQDYKLEKCKYSIFLTRVVRYWYSLENAIDPKKIKKKLKTFFDKDWRVCNTCWEYKLRKEFSKSKASKNWYTPSCITCRRKKHIEYRIKTNRQKDKEYKNKSRHFNIWDIVVLWLLKDRVWNTYWESSREILDYKFKKWYTLENTKTWQIKIWSFANNKSKLKVFYKLN